MNKQATPSHIRIDFTTRYRFEEWSESRDTDFFFTYKFNEDSLKELKENPTLVYEFIKDAMDAMDKWVKEQLVEIFDTDETGELEFAEVFNQTFEVK